MKAKVSQALCQGDVGYGATVNSLSFSSLYILQLSSKKAFSENWWQFGIYWIPVDKNTLSEVLEIIVFCVFNNLGKCCLVSITSLLCSEPPSSADVCPGEGRAALSLSLQPRDPCSWGILARAWELMPRAAPRLAWHRSAPAAPSPGDDGTESSTGGCMLGSSVSPASGIFRANPLLVIPWERAE